MQGSIVHLLIYSSFLKHLLDTYQIPGTIFVLET